MRLFNGISVPPQISASASALIEKLREAAPLRWSPAENLHITTKFIGDWPEPRLSELQARLSEMALPAAFEISVSQLGYLPDSQNPRVFFARVEGGEPLRSLASRTEKLLAGLGVKPESRPYTPHLTLARLPQSGSIAALRHRIEELSAEGETFEIGAFTVHHFDLYLSRNGAYTKLSTYPFEKAAT